MSAASCRRRIAEFVKFSVLATIRQKAAIITFVNSAYEIFGCRICNLLMRSFISLARSALSPEAISLICKSVRRLETAPGPSPGQSGGITLNRQAAECAAQKQCEYPKLRNVEPFKTVLSGNREAIAKLSLHDLEKILFATLTGMSVDDFEAEVKKWLTNAKDERWKRPYTELIYQPMLEFMQYLSSNGIKKYIVTGGGQDFVRVYSQQVYAYRPSRWLVPLPAQSTATVKT